MTKLLAKSAAPADAWCICDNEFLY